MRIFVRIEALFGSVKARVAQLAQSLRGKRVAIIGVKYVGKTTLGEYLDTKHLRRTRSNTNDKVKVDRHIEISNGRGKKPARFDIPEDLPGQDGNQFPNWKKAIKDATHVWYLFRADLIHQRDPEHIALVEEHLRLLVDERKSDITPPKVLLVGTHAESLSSDEISQLKHQVPLALMAPALNANVIAGSLAKHRSASRLVRQIGREIS